MGVIKILAQGLDREPSSIWPTDTLDELGAFDSLEVVEIAMAIEHEFRIDADDREMLAVRTVQDLIDLVRSKMP
jgi:acyl carrier protein